jgi:hypothetical protein
MRAEVEIGHIAGEGQRSERRIGQQVADHSCLQPARRAEFAGQRDRVQPDRGGHEVSDDGHQPEHGVHPHGRAQ